jgi:hypothetical protein
MPRLPLTTKRPPLIEPAASYLLTEDEQFLLAEDGQALQITNAPTPLYTRRGTLFNCFADLLGCNCSPRTARH